MDRPDRTPTALGSSDADSYDTLLRAAEELVDAGDFPGALERLTEACRLCEAAGAEAQIAQVMTRIGEIYVEQGKTREAVDTIKDALGRFQALRDQSGVIRAHRVLGAAYRLGGLPKLAIEHLEPAERLLRRVKNDEEWALVQIELGELNEERSNFREAAHRYTRALLVSEKREDNAAIANCLLHLGSVMRERGDIADSMEHINRALGILEAAGTTDKPELIAVYLELGSTLHEQGNPEGALERLRRALDLAEAIDNKPARSEALRKMGVAHLVRGEFTQASDCFERAIDLADNDDVVGLSDAHGWLGEVLEAQGKIDAAISAYRTALALDQGHHDDVIGIARTQRRLGSVYRKSGRHDRAEDSFREAQALLRKGEDDPERALLFLSWGELFEDQGRFELATDHYNRALGICERISDPLGQATCLRHLGSVLWEKGNFDEAAERLSRAMGLLESLGSQDKVELVAIHILQGAVQEDAGYPGEALKRFRQALDLADSLGLQPAQAETLRRMGTAYMQEGEFEKAREVLRRSVRVSEELDDDTLIAKSRARYGEVLQALGDLDGALDAYRGALAIEQRHQSSIGAAKCHLRLGSAFHYKGNLARAQEAFDESESLLRNAEDEVGTALLETAQGALYQTAGQYEKAMDQYIGALAINEGRGNLVGIGNCLRHLGSLAIEIGDAAAAAEHLNRAHGILESLGRQSGPELAEIQGLLAESRVLDSQTQVDLTEHRHSLALAQKMDLPLAQARAHLRLADALAAQGDMQLAHVSLSSAERLCEETGDTFFIVNVRLARAKALETNEEYADAAREYAAAGRLISHAGRWPARALTLLGGARCERHALDIGRAEELLDEAEEAIGQIEGSPRLRADLWLERGAHRELASDYEEAGRYYEQALDLSSRLKDQASVTACHNRLISVALQSNDRAKAMYHALAVAAIQPGGDPSAWTAMLRALSPALADQALASFKAGAFQDAVAAAFRVCEEAFKARCPSIAHPTTTPVDTYIKFWFESGRGGLSPWAGTTELTGFMNFCLGAFRAGRNPAAHRTVAMDATEAFCWIGVANLILSLMDPADAVLGSELVAAQPPDGRKSS